MGGEVDYGGRSGLWGEKWTMGGEVDYGGRSGLWGEKWTMGGEVDYGGRSGLWGEKWTMGGEMGGEGVHAHLGGLRDDVVNDARGILHEGSLAYPSIIHNRVLD